MTDFPVERQHESDSAFSDRLGRVRRNVRHRYPELIRSGNIDIVVACAS
jgi:hypothetical protein